MDCLSVKSILGRGKHLKIKKNKRKLGCPEVGVELLQRSSNAYFAISLLGGGAQSYALKLAKENTIGPISKLLCMCNLPLTITSNKFSWDLPQD